MVYVAWHCKDLQWNAMKSFVSTSSVMHLMIDWLWMHQSLPFIYLTPMSRRKHPASNKYTSAMIMCKTCLLTHLVVTFKLVIMVENGFGVWTLCWMDPCRATNLIHSSWRNGWIFHYNYINTYYIDRQRINEAVPQAN